MTENKKDVCSPAVLAEDLIFKYRIVNGTDGYMLLECDVQDIVVQIIVRCQDAYAKNGIPGGKAGERENSSPGEPKHDLACQSSLGRTLESDGLPGSDKSVEKEDGRGSPAPLIENGIALLDEWAGTVYFRAEENETYLNWETLKLSISEPWRFERFAKFCAGKINKAREEERKKLVSDFSSYGIKLRLDGDGKYYITHYDASKESVNQARREWREEVLAKQEEINGIISEVIDNGTSDMPDQDQIDLQSVAWQELVVKLKKEAGK